MLKYTDEEVAVLVKRVKRGETKAFEELVIIYQKFVYGTVLADVGNVHDAEDISQEVFLKAWRGINGFRGECSFATWLRRIAKNAACDFLRKEQKRKEITDDPETVLAGVVSTDLTPEEEFLDREGVLNIEKIINTLPEEQREAVIYRDLMGITYLEIADITGVTVGTVKSRISRGRETVKTAIENYLASQKEKGTNK
ncbi:MAG: sigma-70 family RNA polymerase sigma factor [Ruminococcaceae bacterium]|nr:sigma-70 family RNA polymerase sigma factor [Oscillospiraceae bacterium]